MESKFGSCEDCFGKYGACGVFDGRSCGQAPCEACDLDFKGSNKRMYIQCSAITFDVGIRGHDDFFYGAGADPVDEMVNCEVGGFYSFERGDMSIEYVVYPFAHAGFFEADDVLGLLDDADYGVVAFGIGAYSAGGAFSKIETFFALFDIFFDVADGVCELHGFFGV